MPSLSAYHLTWVSLTLGVGYHFTVPQQSTAAAPYLGQGYPLTVTPTDLECRVAPVGPPAPAQPLLLGRGVAPLGRRPWPRTWGTSSAS